MTNTISLDENYSTTRLLCKIVNDECLMMNGRIKEECKWNINNSEFNIQNSKLIGSPEDKFETVLFLPEGEERKGEGGLRTQGYFKQSYEDKPLISIVTVVYNGEQFLEETIKSVINQTYDNVEYIIIDGGSTDGTLDIIKKYEDRIDYWVSEKDMGISDAFNKGIIVSKGEYLNFLNAGDFFISNKSIKEINFSNKEDIISYFVKFGNITIPRYELKNTMPLYKKARLSHQGSFIKHKLFKLEGLYDTRFKIRMDYEFWMRILTKYKFKFIKETIIFYDDNGVSSNNLKQFYSEEFIINYKYLSKVNYLYRYFQIKIKKIFKI